MSRHAWTRSVAASAIAFVCTVSTTAWALQNGTIGVTDHALDPSSKTFDRDLRKAMRTSLKADASGHWHVYFVAYLNKAPGAEEVNAVFYDLPLKKDDQPSAFPIQTKPSARILMSDLDLSPEQGLKAGKYQLRITRLVDGKETVLAKTNLELK